MGDLPKEYPRIYNLFPRRAGTIAQWEEHLSRISRMGFNWVWVNPYQETGNTVRIDGRHGSLYATRDHFTVDPDFSDSQRRHHCSPAEAREMDREAIRLFVKQAHSRGLKVMADLVANHMAIDSPLVTGTDPAHPGSEKWFRRNTDGSLHIVSGKGWQWDDVAQFDCSNPKVRPQILQYLGGVIDEYGSLGFDGMRCDAAQNVAPDVWKEMIQRARQKHPDSFWMGELLGGRWKDYSAYKEAGFDSVTNSIAYAIDRTQPNLVAPWFEQERNTLHTVAPSIGFPESHDMTPTITIPQPDGERYNRDAERIMQLQRYALAALISDGVFMPMGYEYGLPQDLVVSKGRSQTIASEMKQSRLNIADDIARINAIAVQQLKPCRDRVKELMAVPEHPSHVMLRIQDGTQWDPKEASLVMILEKDLVHPARVEPAEMQGIAQALGRRPADITSLMSDRGLTILFSPSLQSLSKVAWRRPPQRPGGGATLFVPQSWMR